MTDRLPHVREPSSGEPDVCVHCREEWVDLLTLYETDECSVRLRAEVERLRSSNDDYLLEMGRKHALLRDQTRGENAERAAVVAWLRQEANAPHPSELGAPMLSPSGRGLLLLNASAIERGEHLRKETAP